MKNLKVDIGIDELGQNSYAILIADESNSAVAYVYGKTPEQAQERAMLLINAYNNSVGLNPDCKHNRTSSWGDLVLVLIVNTAG